MIAGVICAPGNYRVIYLSFGFEAIDNAADRGLLMERIMDYLEGPTDVEIEEKRISPVSTVTL